MIKDHSDSERGNPLPPHGLFDMHHPKDRITYTMAFVTPVVEHWLERDIAQWVHHERSIRRPIAPWANALTTELHLAPSNWKTLFCLLIKNANMFWTLLKCASNLTTGWSVMVLFARRSHESPSLEVNTLRNGFLTARGNWKISF